MIVRIQGEGQFELEDSEREELERLDQELFSAIQKGEEETFESAIRAVADFIKRQGSPVPDEKLVTSDIILPASDTNIDEAKRLLTDEGYLEPVEA